MKDLDIIGGHVKADHYYGEYYHRLKTNSATKTIEILGWDFQAEDCIDFESWCHYMLQLEGEEYINLKYLQINDHPSSTAPYYLHTSVFPLSDFPQDWIDAPDWMSDKRFKEKFGIGHSLAKFKKFNFESESTEIDVGIVADYMKGELTLHGRMYSYIPFENIIPAIIWMNNYITNEKGKFTLIFKLYYFNTAASKVIAELLHFAKRRLDDLLQIIWYHHEEDEDMEEAGEEFQKLVKHEFIFKHYD